MSFQLVNYVIINMKVSMAELFIKFLTRESENQFSKMYEIVLFNNHKDKRIWRKNNQIF